MRPHTTVAQLLFLPHSVHGTSTVMFVKVRLLLWPNKEEFYLCLEFSGIWRTYLNLCGIIFQALSIFFYIKWCTQILQEKSSNPHESKYGVVLCLAIEDFTVFYLVIEDCEV